MKDNPRKWKAVKSESDALARIALTKGDKGLLGLQLTRAASQHEITYARLLLEHGADPNSRDAYDSGPILRAVKSGDLEMVRLLIEHGADVNLFAICAPPLLTACYYYKREIVELLLKQGANPNATSFAGVGILRAAVQTPGNLELIKLLLAHGANPTWRDNHDKSPIDYAKEAGNTEVLKLLQSATRKRSIISTKTSFSTPKPGTKTGRSTVRRSTSG